MENKVDWIAERSLVMVVTSTGERVNLLVQIGRPYWIEVDSQAACDVRIEGLMPEAKRSYGIDPFQAIQSSMIFIDSYLSGVAKKNQIEWPDGELYIESESK